MASWMPFVSLMLTILFVRVQGMCYERASLPAARSELSGMFKPRDYEQCAASCQDQSYCSGMEWDAGFAPHLGIRCWLHRGLAPNPDYDHYTMIPCAEDEVQVYEGNELPSCPTFTKTPFSKSEGQGYGEEQATTLDSCKYACSTSEGCVSFDYYIGDSDLSKCIIFTNKVTFIRDTEHYRSAPCEE